MADLGPGTMPRGKYPESPAPAGSHALISRTPTPGGMLHANLGLPRPPPRNFQPPLPQQPPKQTQQRRHNVPPVQSLRDSAAATPVGCAAWRRRFRIFSFRYREMMSGMTMIFLTVMFFPPGILSQALPRPALACATALRTNAPPHRHSGISAARRACLPTGAPGEFFHTLSRVQPPLPRLAPPIADGQNGKIWIKYAIWRRIWL